MSEPPEATRSSDEGTPLQRLADRLALALRGGVRVRVLAVEPRPRGVVRGRTPGPPPARILREVLDLRPPGPGTLDLHHDGRGRWKVRARGGLADPRFVQRVRNVLGNS